MIKFSAFYPREEGKRFNMSYYCEKHMPLVQRLCGSALKGMAVEQGICGMTPGSPAPFVAIGHAYFESAEAFQAAFAAHMDEIAGDLGNFTDIQPVVQISEVKL